MKICRLAFLGLLAVYACASAAAAQTATVKDDLAQLQGEWTMESGSADGVDLPELMLKQMKRICRGDETTALMGEKVYFKAKITLDPSQDPKAIDYEMTDGVTKGKTQLGIYELDGDTFRSCFGSPGAERPTDFTTKPGDGRTLSTWKRAESEAR